MNNITVSAPGKLHLLGEHAVVYGKPAILATVNKRTSIEIQPRKDRQIAITSKNTEITHVYSEELIRNKTIDAQTKWEAFSKNNDLTILKSITENIFDFAIIAIGETLQYYHEALPSGFTLSIDSQIISHCGMGSSAAIAVAITAAVSLFLDKAFDKQIINHIAFLTEQKKHGFPSGGDNSVSSFGGLVWFRKETSNFNVIQQIPFMLATTIASNFMIVFTGIPTESTGEMVSGVRSKYQHDKKNMDILFDEQETLTRELLVALQSENHEKILEIIKEGERNLEIIGVVSEYVKTIIRKIEKAGGAAKICGGGGKTKGTGVVLVYAENKKKLESLLRKENLEFSEIILGHEGVRIEKKYA